MIKVVIVQAVIKKERGIDMRTSYQYSVALAISERGMVDFFSLFARLLAEVLMRVFNRRSFQLLPLTLARAQDIFGTEPKDLWVHSFQDPHKLTDADGRMVSGGWFIDPRRGRTGALGAYWDSGLYNSDLDEHLKALLGSADHDMQFTFSLRGDEIVIRPKVGSPWPASFGAERRFLPSPDSAPIKSFADPFHDEPFVRWVASRGVLPPLFALPAQRHRQFSYKYAFAHVIELAAGVVLAVTVPKDIFADKMGFRVYLREDKAAQARETSAGALIKSAVAGFGCYYDPHIGLNPSHALTPHEIYDEGEMRPLIVALSLQIDDQREYVWQREPSLWQHRLAKTL